MRIKTSIFVACCSLFLLLWSCNDSSESFHDKIVADDAQLLSLSLSHDSISELAATSFVIDHNLGTINNPDSMTYGTELSYKAKIGFSIQDGAELRVKGEENYLSSSDSLDITGEMPIDLEVTSPNGKVKKTYSFWINIHSLDPDSIHYQRMVSDLDILNADETKAIQLNGVYYLFAKTGGSIALYQSGNITDWAPVSSLDGLPEDTDITHLYAGGNMVLAFTGSGALYISYDVYNWSAVTTDYPVQSILGHLGNSQIQTDGFAFVVDKDGVSTFAFTPDFTTWTYGSAVPSNFPIKEFSSVSYLTMNIERISLFGGSNPDGESLGTVWSTTNGYQWSKINSDKMSFPALKGANAILYDGAFYVMNGMHDITLNRTVYYSIDGGNTWSKGEDKIQVPDDYSSRYNASLVADTEDIHFFIFGGTRSGVSLTDVWQGYKNELIFD